METGRIILLLWIGTICLSPCLYLDIPVFREDPKSAEALFILWLSVLILLGCVCDKNVYRVNKSELAFLSCYLFCTAKDVCKGDFDYSGLFESLFPVWLYFSIRRQLVRHGMIACRYIFWLLVLMIMIQVVLCLKGYYSGESFSYIYLPNTSLFGVLIATQLAFIAGAGFSSRFAVWPIGKYGAVFPVVVMIFGVLLLLFAKGRSGWLGLTAAVLMLNMFSAKSKTHWLRRVLVCMVFFVVFMAFLIGLKTDSSSGRMLIYKISFRMLREHWLWGIGQGQFARQYNLYQSRYFESVDIDSREALLADNVYYAFNDFLQLLVEHGITGGLLFLLAVLVFLRRMRDAWCSSLNKIMIPFFTILVCASVSSSFIYSFHHLSIFLLVMVAFAFCNARSGNGEVVMPAMFGKLVRGMCVISALLLIIDGFDVYLFRKKACVAGELVKSGLNAKAILMYGKLEKTRITDGKVLFSYARLLYQSGQLSSAAAIIEKAKRYFISNELFLFAAKLYAEMKNFPAAEMNYKIALYMVPGRMQSRYELMEFYLQRRDTGLVKYWAGSILHMPVKIRSVKVELMQKATSSILSRQAH